MHRFDPCETVRPGLRQTYMVSVCTRPVTGQARTLCVPAGATIAEEVARRISDPVLRGHAVVRINGTELERSAWTVCRPRPGTLVEIGVRPHGGDGGSNPFRLILQLALVAATIWIGGGGLYAAGLLGKGFAAGSLGAGLAAGAASVLGGYAINAIAPPPQPGLAGRSAGESISPTYFLQAARNQNRLGQVVPKVLGKRRMVPPIGAKYYTEAVGSEIYLRGLLCWGVGPVALDDLKTGDTPFSELDAEIEHALGFDDDPVLTLYPRAVDEIEGGGELLFQTGWVRRTTSADAAEISLDVDFPQGLVEINPENGAKLSRSVDLEIRYAPADSEGAPVGGWSYEQVNVPDANTAATDLGGNRLNLNDSAISYEDWYGGLPGGGGGAAFGAWTVTRATRQPFRVNRRWAVPVMEHGYVVEVRRVTENSGSDYILDLCNWSVLRSISANPPVLASNIALTAFRVRATGQFNGVLDDINAVITSVVDTWQEGTGWTGDNLAPSQNPGDLLNEVLGGTANKRPLGPARINYDDLATFWIHCDTNGYRFNHIVDYDTSVEEVVQAICASGRARAFWNGPLLSIAIDAAKPVRQALSGRSVRSYRGRITFPGPLHGVRVPFNNEQKGYLLDERIVYAPGFNAANATAIEALELVGKTDPDEIHTEGLFHIASAIAQAGEAHEIIVDADTPGLTLGERFVFSHDVPLASAVAGRVTDVTLNGGGDVVAVTLDEYAEMEAGESYGIRWKYPVVHPAAEEGEDSYVYEVSEGLTVETEAGRTRTLTLATPVAPGDAPQAGDEIMFGVLSAEVLDLLVLSLDTSGDDAIRIAGVPYAPSRFTGETPPTHVTGVTGNYTPRPPQPVLTAISATPDGLAVDFRYPAGAENPAVQTEAAWRQTPPAGVDEPYDPLPPVPANIGRLVTPPVDQGLTYDLQLTGVSADGKRSVPLIIAQISGQLYLPDPVNVTAQGVTLDGPTGSKIPALRVTADAVTDSRATEFVIEAKPAGADAADYEVVATAPAAAPRRDVRAIAPGVALDVKVYFRGRRPFGTQSETPVEILNVSIPDILVSTDSGGVGGRSAADILADLTNRELAAEENAKSLINEVLDRHEKVRRRADEIRAARQEAFNIVETERTERLAGDEAEAITRQTQISGLGDALALVEAETVTNASNLAAFTSTTNTQLSLFGDSLALVESDITTVASDLAALTTSTSTQFSTVNGNIAAVQTQVTTNATNLAAEVDARTTAVATVAGNLATLESSYNLTVDDVSSLSTSLTSLSATVSSQGSLLTAVSSDLTTAEANIDLLLATRIIQVTAGTTFAGVQLSAVESGGGAASDIRFAAGKIGYGTDYASPDMVLDMVSRSRYVWNAARTHKTVEENWDSGRIRLRAADGTLLWDTANGGLQINGEPATGDTGKINGQTIQPAEQIVQLSADFNFGTTWKKVVGVHFENVVKPHAFFLAGTQINMRPTSRGTGAADDECTVNWEIKVHPDGDENTYANGSAIVSGAIVITETGAGAGVYWSASGGVLLQGGTYTNIMLPTNSYPKTHHYVLWVRIGSGAASQAWLDGVSLPSGLEVAALSPHMAQNPV